MDSKKELESMRIVRNKDLSYTVSVSEYMDSALEDEGLIYDCLTDEEAGQLTDDMIEQIQQILVEDVEFRESTEETGTLKKDAGAQDMLVLASSMIESCHKTLHKCFLSCMAATLNVLYEGNPDADSIIEERIRNEK